MGKTVWGKKKRMLRGGKKSFPFRFFSHLLLTSFTPAAELSIDECYVILFSPHENPCQIGVLKSDFTDGRVAIEKSSHQVKCLAYF